MDKKDLIIIFFVAVIFSYRNIYAEEKISPYYLEKKYATCEDCIKNFNIEDVNFQHFQIRKEENLALINYFSCRATIKNDINVCNKLLDSDRAKCYGKFNTRGFFVKLLYAQQLTPDLMHSCIVSKFGDTKVCRQFIYAFIKGDDLSCKNLYPDNRIAQSRCQALIKLDEKLTTDKSFQNIIYFMKAVKDFELKACKEIEDENLRILCKGYISIDEKICQEYVDFKKIRDRYCKEEVEKRR